MINLDFLQKENLKQYLKIRQILIVFGLFLILALTAFYIIPTAGFTRDLMVQISRVRKETEVTSQIIQDFDRINQDITMNKDNIEKLSYIAFPAGKIGPIYEYINTIASENGLILAEFSLGNQEPARGISNIDSRSFTLKLSGSYESLKNFLSRLESSLRLIEFQRFSIVSQKAGKEQGSEENLFDINADVKAYIK